MDRKKMYSLVVTFVCFILMGIMILYVGITADAATTDQPQIEQQVQTKEAKPLAQVIVGVPDRMIPQQLQKGEEENQTIETQSSKPVTGAVEELIVGVQRQVVTEISLEDVAESSAGVESPSITSGAEQSEADVTEEVETEEAEEEFYWDGPVLNSYVGVVEGPSGKETYYNLPMGGVVSIMRNIGFDEENYPYYVREDGCKMLGDYIMVAANLDLRPRGSIVKTSLGWGIVSDTGGFASSNPTQLDIAVDW